MVACDTCVVDEEVIDRLCRGGGSGAVLGSSVDNRSEPSITCSLRGGIYAAGGCGGSKHAHTCAHTSLGSEVA